MATEDNTCHTPVLPKRLARPELLDADVNAPERLQAETAAELDALLPAIVNKALKGKS